MRIRIILFIYIMLTSYVWGENEKDSFLQEYMNRNNINGTVVIESFKKNKTYIYNVKRSNEEFLPASTFKIVNTLIALQENVILDENEILKWDGQNKGFPDWNKDQNLKTAFPLSCVWFYQELAKKIGNNKYQSYLNKMNYGNLKTGDNIDSFWLDGDLRISAIGQIKVLKNIYSEKYTFKSKYYKILKTLMIVDKTENYVVRAKTGTVSRVTPNIGWYVGYMEIKDDILFFACNLDMFKTEQSKLRKEIIYTAFKELKIII